MNHYPQDIEETVKSAHEHVEQGAGAAIVVGEEGAEKLVIVQETVRQRDIDFEAILEAIRKKVALDHELAVAGVVLIKTRSIPKTSSGKIQRHACRDGYLAGTLAVRASWTAETGKVEIINNEEVAIDFDAYVIQSPGNDLNATTWTSMEDQSVTDWEEVSPSASALSELNLLSSTVLAAAGVIDLGAAYSGGVLGVEDLTFEFGLTAEIDLMSLIEYVIAGDMDGDGDVDEFDAPLIVQALINRAAYDANGFTTGSTDFLIDADVNGDVNGNGIFDLGDVAAFSGLFSGSASASTVPEPASAMLMLVAAGLLSMSRRRQRRL